MSKKDYQAIAAAFYQTRQTEVRRYNGGRDTSHEAEHHHGVLVGLDLAQSIITTILAADNPRFKRERFIEACETGKTRGMRQVA